MCLSQKQGVHSSNILSMGVLGLTVWALTLNQVIVTHSLEDTMMNAALLAVLPCADGKGATCLPFCLPRLPKQMEHAFVEVTVRALVDLQAMSADDTVLLLLLRSRGRSYRFWPANKAGQTLYSIVTTKMTYCCPPVEALALSVIVHTAA